MLVSVLCLYSVEELDRPGLKDKPMAVGGMGMICTANYLARQFGVRSAMPGFIAKKLCPQVCAHACALLRFPPTITCSNLWGSSSAAALFW
jgi:nucleotidyltransferase/DNA polymerase involved in DNA repair